MTGPIPDFDTGTLDSGQALDQQAALATYLKEHRVAFTLQYVPQQEYWVGLFIDYAGGKSTMTVGRYPTEVIYKLLRDSI